MRLPPRSFSVPIAMFSLLGLVAAIFWLASAAPAYAQVPVHFFKGEVFVDGKPAEDGTRVRAFVDNVRVGETRTRGGAIALGVPQTLGEKFQGKVVEFRGIAPDGRQFVFPQTSIWQPNGETPIKLNFGSGFFDNRRPEEPFKINGKILMGGRPAPDGTRIEAFVDGFHVGEARTRGGTFDLFLTPPPPPQPPPDGKIVEFGGTTPDGKRFDFHETVIWRPGEQVHIAFEAPGFQQPANQPRQPRLPIQQIPDGLDIQCAIKVLGRIPAGPQDMSPEESLKLAQNCFSGGQSQNLEEEQERLKREQALHEEQQRLDRERLRQEQVRIRRQQELQAEQDRLEQDRLKSERVRQEEQARLDRERFQQEQERIRQEGEFEKQRRSADTERERQRIDQERQFMEQQTALDRERMDRERNLEEERVQRERERIDREFNQKAERIRREVELNVSRQELEQERQRIIREGGNPPPLPPLDEDRDPLEEKPEKKGPTRGFFSNTTVGGLGTANNLMDPTKLAILGILLTLGATMMQMVRGN